MLQFIISTHDKRKQPEEWKIEKDYSSIKKISASFLGIKLP